MLKGAVVILVAFASLAVAIGAPKVNAKMAKCYLAVNNTVFLNGACSFEFMNGEGSIFFEHKRFKDAMHELRLKCW